MVPVNDLKRQAIADRALVLGAMERVVDSGWYILGPEVSAFENEFAHYLGVAHVIGLANGTDALELAMRSLGAGPGDEILMAANAGGYAATAARLLGARPVFCDVRSDALIDPVAAAAAVTASTRAVVATHLYGQMCDVHRLRELLPPGVRIIEDCAQAHGARRGGILAGSIGDVSTFSFYPTKNLAAVGDGGAIATSDAAIATALRSLRMYGWSTKYTVAMTGGRNSRLDELQAAVLAARLPLLDERNRRRREIAAEFRRVAPFPVLGDDDESFVGHLCVMVVDDRDHVRSALAAAGVQTDVHYPTPDYRQAVWAEPDIALPMTERLCASVVTLPCFPEMTDSEVTTVAVGLERLR